MAADPRALPMGGADPSALTAIAARERLGDGALRSEELAAACLRRIGSLETEVRAWAHLDETHVMRQAGMLDNYRQSGGPTGMLHGLPVGIKDIIDTADLPTENGNALDAGRRPESDATIVSRLRSAGALIMGKTVSTECAYLAPAKTRNPHNGAHTPGGSSSGSAAAVACGMVPLAIGTQTGGSVVRPASYCGVVGFKPTFGLVPRTGVLRTSRRLDTIGTFARTVEDAALLADAMAGFDPGDPDTRPAASPRILDTARSDPPAEPQFAFVKSPAWPEVEPDCAAGFDELRDALGDRCDEFELPELFAEGAAAQRIIHLTEFAHNLRHYHARGADRLAAETRGAIEEGGAILAADYLAATDWRDTLYAGLEEIFSRYDAIITPAAGGEAPAGLESTGSAAFNVLWTLTGVPAVSLPLLQGAKGLPIGVQLIGRRHNDGRLMRSARWLVDALASEG